MTDGVLSLSETPLGLGVIVLGGESGTDPADRVPDNERERL